MGNKKVKKVLSSSSAKINKKSSPTSLKKEPDVKITFQVNEEKYDSSNALIVLPKSKKSKEKIQPKKKVAPLSKTKRKRLQKVIQRKEKLSNRAGILEKLQSVQATAEELKLMTSISSIQTSGLKKFIAEINSKKCVETDKKISNVKGSKKKACLPPKKKLKSNPNVVGFENDTSSSEEESEASSVECNEVPSTIEDSSSVIEENIPENDQSQLEMSEDNHEQNKKNDLKKIDIDGATKDIESKNVETEQTEIENNSKYENKEEIENKNHEPAVFVPVERLPEIQAARTSLPIFCEEHAIMEAVRENAVVVIHGETGTGKTTQVPQFLYEAGYAQNGKLIGITEPRRIAAISMSSRVAKEMNMPDVVSYHIRYDKNISDKTKIKFMTDGVLLKEIRHDFFLSRYSVIIIDEAHERSVFSDVLIGLLSRILPLREKKGSPLKLIIMSATIKVEDFTENPRLFKITPFLIKLESRQYKVEIHFNRKTPDDYIDGAYQKVCKIHQQLPAGGILVFVTGKNEVTKLCNLLRNRFPKQRKNFPFTEEAEHPNSSNKRKRKKDYKESDKRKLPSKIDLDQYAVDPLDLEALQYNHSDGEECLSDDEIFETSESVCSSEPLYVLPLYSLLPSNQQEKIFNPPPIGSRLCVVSTNVAETSITIPGLKYIVDTGKEKTKVYDRAAGGISSFLITWISKASSNQRAGRAGRTEGGHCYRLYSSAVFENELPEFAPPEILRTPVDDVLLQMKALGIDRVVSFPFPTQPDTEALKAAEKRLVLLGALHDLQKYSRHKDVEKWEYSAKITPLGQAMSRFPLSPRYAKMLLMSYKHKVIQHTIAIVSAMTVPEVFNASAEIREVEADIYRGTQWLGIKKIGAGKGKSTLLGDVMVFLRATALYEESMNKASFCSKNGIRHKAMIEIHKMRMQLTREMNRSFENLTLPLKFNLEPPTDKEIDLLRKIIVTGFTDHIAKKISTNETKGDKSLTNAYKCESLLEPVFIHPSSIFSSLSPELIVFQEITQTTKYYMRNVAGIEPEWLPSLASTLCTFSNPLETIPPNYDPQQDKILCSMTSKFGRWQWDLPCVRMEMPKSLAKYNLFCFYLLDGQVCPLFKEYKPLLLSSPSIMLKTWAKLLPRTQYILKAIISKEIGTREALYEVWKTESKFLLREFWEWLPEEKHMEVECKWPPLPQS